MTFDPVIVLVVRLGLALLLLGAAFQKLRDIGDFRVVLATYRVLPDRFVGVAAWIVVAFEVVVGIGALLQIRPAYVGAIVLLLGYAGAMALNLWRGRRLIDCGCGGGVQPLTIGLVVRNVVLAVGASVALSPAFVRPLGWLDFVSVTGGTAMLVLLYAATNQLLAARARLEEWV